MKKQAGFTLIEVLIALFVFAILGTISAVGLRAVLQTHDRLKKADAQLMQLAIATTIMQRDIVQIIQRPITDASGQVIPPLVIPDTKRFEFTRAGYTNPFQAEKRSSLQRVSYIFENHTLKRVTWPALDLPPHVASASRVLLTNIDSMELSFVDQNGQPTDAWAANTSSQAGSQQAVLPNALVITFHFKKYGRWQGVFPIVGRGYNAAT